ncbi:MAG: helix-turn-helix domain-containing protein [Bacteroides sp.]|nr:helix-turn-helix domain-containing protein [Bacteroides sp.]
MSYLQLSLLANVLLLMVIVGGVLYYFLRVRPRLNNAHAQQPDTKGMPTSLADALIDARSLMTADQRLYDRFIDLMVEKQIYRNLELNRAMICKMLNTNHTYLNEAIRLNAEGKSLNDIINSYRVQHAAVLFSEQPELPISEVMLQSGFSSRATFYRLFTKYTKMSPNEFRDRRPDKEQSGASIPQE